MADTWKAGAPLRPQARPEDLGPDPLRPQSRPEGLGAVTEEAQHAATVSEALPLDETVLIGLFNGPEGGTALLRLPGGSIVKVAAGGYVDGGKVTAIDQDGVRLERGDRQIHLTMPS